MESESAFPFRKLEFQKYLTVDILMYLDLQNAYNFMFTLNKKTRDFLHNDFITVRNSFVNEGLIEH